MFTGLVEDLGTIVSAQGRGSGIALGIRTAIPLAEVGVGDSIAVDGACLTAERCDGEVFTAVAGRETLERTTLCDARPGRRVHLERAVRMGDRLGGHLVQGHVDGIAIVHRADLVRESFVLWMELPGGLERYVAAKGSICLDGVSLTVNEVDACRFRVNVVPHTARVTRLASLKPGDRVNVEVDILAKYVERLLGAGAAPASEGALSLETLARNGFLS